MHVGEYIHGLLSYIYDAFRFACGSRQGFRIQGLVTYTRGSLSDIRGAQAWVWQLKRAGERQLYGKVEFI